MPVICFNIQDEIKSPADAVTDMDAPKAGNSPLKYSSLEEYIGFSLEKVQAILNFWPLPTKPYSFFSLVRSFEIKASPFAVPTSPILRRVGSILPPAPPDTMKVDPFLKR